MKVVHRFLLGLLSCSVLSGCAGQPATPNFQQLVLPQTPNYYLACPPKYCNVMPTAYSPVYPVSADDLFNAFNQIIAKQPRVQFVASIPEQGEFMLVAKSVFGLQDDITIQFIALTDTTSTVAIYSRSRYNLIDLGANKRRVEKWFVELNQLLANSAQANQQVSASTTASADNTATTAVPVANTPAANNLPANNPVVNNPTANNTNSNPGVNNMGSNAAATSSGTTS